MVISQYDNLFTTGSRIVHIKLMILLHRPSCLFTDEVHNCYINEFVGETLNHAVLDIGCTKTVCGASWLDSYIKTLSECDQKKVVQSKSESLEMVRPSDH